MAKVIKRFDLDLSDLPGSGELRNFKVIGTKGCEFILEIIDNTTGYYYNFFRGGFQLSKTRLESEITQDFYSGYINFPAVTGSDDKYDIYLYAKPGTSHANYREVRFLDSTIDLNSSIGSNSLMMQKVVHQYADVVLTIAKESLSSTIENTGTGSVDTLTISVPRNKSIGKKAFSLKCVVNTATKAYQIIKQPTASDILAYSSVVVGSAPELLRGENEFPTVTSSGKVSPAVISSTTVTVANLSATPLVGDKFFITDGVNSVLPQIADAVSVTEGSGNVTSSVAVTVSNLKGIQFSNRKNYRWPVDNILRVKPGMSVLTTTNVVANTFVTSYEDSITLNPGTYSEQVIIKNQEQAVLAVGKPTIVNGVKTVQPGNVIFNQQQLLALAGDTIKIGGYGENQVLSVTGYQVKFTDLSIALTPISTLSTEATNAHATISVADREGIINNVSRVGGIGINPAVQNPLITSGGGADGDGDIVMDAVQSLENGITLNIENTSTTATITGNIEIIKAGTSNQTIYFDLERLLSIS